MAPSSSSGLGPPLEIPLAPCGARTEGRGSEKEEEEGEPDLLRWHSSSPASTATVAVASAAKREKGRVQNELGFGEEAGQAVLIRRSEWIAVGSDPTVGVRWTGNRPRRDGEILAQA
jgi:hypothetical protein